LGASSSGIPPQGADSISKPGESEKITGSRDSLVVGNLPTLSIEVTPWEPVISDTSLQGAVGSSKPVDWEPIVLVYHNRELVVPAYLRMRVTLCT
jgi:hypothetical protein